MRPEDVPAEWVKAARDGWWSTESGGDIAMAHALAGVAPLIAAAERERCAEVAEACQLPSRLVDGGPMAGWQTFPHEWPQTIAAAIRALKDTP